mgnify:FL=1
MGIFIFIFVAIVFIGAFTGSGNNIEPFDNDDGFNDVTPSIFDDDDWY